MKIKLTKPDNNDNHVIIQGNTSNGVHSFLGLPYAKPPVGSLRWKPPVPISLYDFDHLDATKFGSASIQVLPLMDPNGLGDGVTENEDCLYLNVWTNEANMKPEAKKKKPVVFWIHGGGLLVWSSSIKVFNGETLARENDVVVVSINYRLGAFGFLHTDAYKKDNSKDIHCNFGVLDWIVGLKWVSQHIHHFGGDPNNVTIYGQSAGGVAVHTLLHVPQADGLYHKVILQSKGGYDYAHAPTSFFATKERLIEESKTYCNFLIGEEEAKNTNDMQKLLSEVPVEKIKQSLLQFSSTPPTDSNGGPLCVFARVIYSPVVDEQIVSSDFTPWAKSKVRYIIGCTKNESRFFLKPWGDFQCNDPDALYNKESLCLLTKTFAGTEDESSLDEFYKLNEKSESTSTYYEAINQLVSTAAFHEPAIALSQKLASMSIPAYVYMFTRATPGAKKSGELAFHCADIPYFFGNLHQNRALKNLLVNDNQEEDDFYDKEIDFQLSKDIRHALFTTFAHTGVPSSSNGLIWPLARNDNLQVATMGDTVTVQPFEKSALFNHIISKRHNNE